MKTREQTKTTKEHKWSNWIGLLNGYKRAWLLVGIANPFDAILQNDWPIEQFFLHIRVFVGGKTNRSCFHLVIHWLMKQITNTYQNHFQGHSKIAQRGHIIQSANFPCRSGGLCFSCSPAWRFLYYTDN